MLLSLFSPYTFSLRAFVLREVRRGLRALFAPADALHAASRDMPPTLDDIVDAMLLYMLMPAS